MIEKHCLHAGCAAYPLFGFGPQWACAAHQHQLGFGGNGKTAEEAGVERGLDPSPRPQPPTQGRLI